MKTMENGPQKTRTDKLIRRLSICASILFVSTCLSLYYNNNGSVLYQTESQYVDYSHGSSLETLDGKLADGLAKVRSMLPIEIEEGLHCVDVQLQAKSIVYYCLIDESIDVSLIDWQIYDEESIPLMEEKFRNEEGQMMVKLCEATGRDIRYVFLDYKKVVQHEQVFAPLKYIITED